MTNNNNTDVKTAFLASRNGAIVRCAGILIDSKRKDLAKQVLTVLNITPEKFKQIRAQNA